VSGEWELRKNCCESRPQTLSFGLVCAMNVARNVVSTPGGRESPLRARSTKYECTPLVAADSVSLKKCDGTARGRAYTCSTEREDTLPECLFVMFGASS
jgi:hypothetical protein